MTDASRITIASLFLISAASIAASIVAVGIYHTDRHAIASRGVRTFVKEVRMLEKECRMKLESLYRNPVPADVVWQDEKLTLCAINGVVVKEDLFALDGSRLEALAKRMGW